MTSQGPQVHSNVLVGRDDLDMQYFSAVALTLSAVALTQASLARVEVVQLEALLRGLIKAFK